MADEEQPFPLGFFSTQQTVMRRHLSGGQIVSGFIDQQQLDTAITQPLIETPTIASIAAELNLGLEHNQAVVQQNRQVVREIGEVKETQQSQEAKEVQDTRVTQVDTVHQQTLSTHQQPEQQVQQSQLQQQQQQQPEISLQESHQKTRQTETSQALLFPPQPPTQQQSKPVNTVFICKLGQETVENIYSHAFEIFQNLKEFPLPNGTVDVGRRVREKRFQLQEKLRVMKLKFRHLQRIFSKCNENCQIQGMEYTDIESLVPLKESCRFQSDKKTTSEAYRLACEEKKKLIEQVVIKNRQLKDIIFHLRRLMYEVNTMLHMRLT